MGKEFVFHAEIVNHISIEFSSTVFQMNHVYLFTFKQTTEFLFVLTFPVKTNPFDYCQRGLII